MPAKKSKKSSAVRPGPKRRPVSVRAKKTAREKTEAPAAVPPAPRTTENRVQPPNRKGLIFFGAIIGLVIVIAVIGKLRQGPPVKMLPVTLLADYSSADQPSGPLSSPRGIAVDGQGNIFVADLGNHRIVVFDAQGKVTATWGKKGNAAGEFNEPSGVAIAPSGELLVADSWNGRIEKFSPQGEYVGEISSQAGNFYSPRNVAADAQGYVYVADTGNSCIKKFDADANLVKRWGEFGPGRERFQETFGLWVDELNRVYVGDAGNRRLKIFTNEGKFIRDIRVKGWQSGIGWPMVAVDGQGRVYAVDVQNNQIWIYTREGKYLGTWGNSPGKDVFASPLGIALGPDGSVYISNMNRGDLVKLAAPRL